MNLWTGLKSRDLVPKQPIGESDYSFISKCQKPLFIKRGMLTLFFMAQLTMDEIRLLLFVNAIGAACCALLAASLFLVPAYLPVRARLSLKYFQCSIICWALAYTVGTAQLLYSQHAGLRTAAIVAANSLYMASYYLIALAVGIRLRDYKGWFNRWTFSCLMVLVALVSVAFNNSFEHRVGALLAISVFILGSSIRKFVLLQPQKHRGDWALLLALVVITTNLLLFTLPSIYLHYTGPERALHLLLFILINGIAITVAVFSLYLNDVIEATRHHGQVDPLSGTLTRRVLVDKHGNWLQSTFDGCLIICDLDKFKTINDLYGHDVGDKVIRSFGLLLKRGVRGQDRVIRYGGEEFLIQLPDTSLSIATEIAERLCREVRLVEIEHQGQILSFTASFGISASTENKTFSQMLIEADQHLYQAKNGGRNRVVGPSQATILN